MGRPALGGGGSSHLYPFLEDKGTGNRVCRPQRETGSEGPRGSAFRSQGNPRGRVYGKASSSRDFHATALNALLNSSKFPHDDGHLRLGLGISHW